MAAMSHDGISGDDSISSTGSERGEEFGGSIFLARMATRRGKHLTIRVCCACGFTALLQRDAEIQASFDKIGRRLDGALEQRRCVRCAVRFNQKNADSIERV